MDKDCCSFLLHFSNSFSSLCPPVLGMEKFLENFLCLSRIAKKNSEKEEAILDKSKIMNRPHNRYSSSRETTMVYYLKSYILI